MNHSDPSRPAFLITIDTEGDNLWGTGPLSTRNAAYLERFQLLCEQYGFKPCYLTNYEMAIDPVYQAFARDVIARGTGEIGMHLHAWNSPPAHPQTDHDGEDKAYLIEYPDDVMRSKVDTMTKLLEDTFSIKMISHRAGRWAFDRRYAELLLEYGYQVDCSVTPHIDWGGTPGKRQGQGGTDYRHFPTGAYFIDPDDIARPGHSALLEIPMSTRLKYPAWLRATRRTLDRLRGKIRPDSISWLRPKRDNLAETLSLTNRILAEGSDYLEFMLHSSEFMPGGSPTFPDEASIEQLYRDMDQLFRHIASRCQGMTLADYHQRFVAKSASRP
ncbi:polysaccharide deacetylase family protein [Paludibacterium sp. THUN1379]|nr:polysaccharide deacetylase family protein [Paludibacterium sp. THUN1379]